MHNRSASIDNVIRDEQSSRLRLYQAAFLAAVPANGIYYWVMDRAGFQMSLELTLLAAMSCFAFFLILWRKKTELTQARSLFLAALVLNAGNAVWVTHANNYNPNLILGCLTLFCSVTPFFNSRAQLTAFAVAFGGFIAVGAWLRADALLPGFFFLVTSALMIPAVMMHKSISDAFSTLATRLSDVYNNAASGIIQLDRSGMILSANVRFIELTEFRERELQKLSLLQICHEDDKLSLKGFLIGVDQSHRAQIDIRIHTRVGRYIWVRLVAGSQTSACQSQYLNLLVLDISQEKKLNELSGFQKQILLMFAKKIPFNQINAEIAKFVSIQTGGLPVVISLLRANSLQVTGSFNLPENLLTSLNRRPVKPGYGNALEAIRKKSLNVVDNISESQWWSDYRAENPKSPLVASWATPIISETGEAAGVIEVFKYTEGPPNNNAIQTLDICSSLTGLAVMVHNSEESHKAYLANFTQTAKLASLGEMAAGIAHEINNPMTIIQGRAEQIAHALRQNPPDLAKVSEVTDNIMKNVQRVAKIIKGLRSFARHTGDSEYANVRVADVIYETLDFCSERFKVNGVQLRLAVIDEKLTILARGPQISQVLLNLFNNAFDAVSDLHNERWIDITVSETFESVQITVTDSGSGITPEVSDRLFQPFFTTKGVDKGTGLGLSISHGIVTDHGGRIFVDLKCPNTRFVVELPKSGAHVHRVKAIA
jgi:PAS domain S-box-containing protein